MGEKWLERRFLGTACIENGLGDALHDGSCSLWQPLDRLTIKSSRRQEILPARQQQKQLPVGLSLAALSQSAAGLASVCTGTGFHGDYLHFAETPIRCQF